jgi:hypothetical protein
MDEPAPHSSAAPSVERRLQAKLPGGEPIVAWCRAWVSRDTRLHMLLAARTLDFVVLTDDHLYLISTGFLTRRPRRRVYTISLDRLRVEEWQAKGRWATGGRRLRLLLADHRPLVLEMRGTARHQAFIEALLEDVPADRDGE